MVFFKKKVLIFLIGTVFCLISFTYLVNKKGSKPQIYKSAAEDIPPGSPAWCADHCKPDPQYNPCNQTESYGYADCCIQLAQTGDPFACSWPDRGYCLDSQCASIPAEVNKQRCGGPKHSWCNLCTENHCPGYGVPVNTPNPTASPVPINTPKPISNPNLSDNPTPTIYQQPTVINTPSISSLPTLLLTGNQKSSTNIPTIKWQPNLIEVQVPSKGLSIPDSIKFMKFTNRLVFIPIKETIEKISQVIDKKGQKSLDLFEYIFNQITKYDQILEQRTNEVFKQILRKK